MRAIWLGKYLFNYPLMVSTSYTQSLYITNCELDLKNIYLAKIILTFGFHCKDDRIVTKLERNQRFKPFKVYNY